MPRRTLTPVAPRSELILESSTVPFAALPLVVLLPLIPLKENSPDRNNRCCASTNLSRYILALDSIPGCKSYDGDAFLIN
jgi:hypothetical protein